MNGDLSKDQVNSSESVEDQVNSSESVENQENNSESVENSQEQINSLTNTVGEFDSIKQKDIQDQKNSEVSASTSNMSEASVEELSLLKEMDDFNKNTPPPRLKMNLHQNNFNSWCVCLKSVLFYYKLDPIIDQFTSPVETLLKNKDFKRYNGIVLNLMLEHMEDNVRSKFSDNSLASELYKSIEKFFNGNKQVQSIKLFNKINEVLVNKPENLELLVNTVKSTMNQFEELYKDNTKEIWKCIFISSLSNKHQQLRTVLLSNENHQIEDYFNLAIKEQQIFNTSRQIKINSIQTPSTSINKYRSGCFECGNENHVLKDCRIFKEKVKRDKNYKPQELINYLIRMKNRSRPMVANVNPADDSDQQSNNQDNDQREDKSNEQTSESYYPLCTVLCNINFNKSNEFYLDSGAAAHVLNSSEGVYEIKESNGCVSTATGTDYKIEAIGKKEIKSSLGCSLELSNVIVCTNLQANFLSVSKLTARGFKVIFEENMANIFYGKKPVLKAILEPESGLYKVKLEEAKLANVNVNNQSNGDDSSSVVKDKTIKLKQTDPKEIMKWHQTLGHININDLRRLKEKLKIYIPSNLSLNCDACAKSKLSRISFNSSITDQAKAIGDQIHLDLSGKVRVFNRYRFAYFLLASDVFSRFIYVFLLKTKDQVPDHVINLIKRINNENVSTVKVIHSDMGSEFKNITINDFCLANGIKQQFTNAGNPQQNGLIERLNRSIENMARSMLTSSNLSTYFWPQAVAYAVHVKNRIPHSGIDGKIPIEMYKNKTMDIDQYNKLNVFGSKVFYLIENPKNKFAQVGKEAIYLGKSKDNSGHLIYDFEEKIFLEKLHVKFTSSLYTREQIEQNIKIADGDYDYVNQRFYEEDEYKYFANRRLRSSNNDQQNQSSDNQNVIDDDRQSLDENNQVQESDQIDDLDRSSVNSEHYCSFEENVMSTDNQQVNLNPTESDNQRLVDSLIDPEQINDNNSPNEELKQQILNLKKGDKIGFNKNELAYAAELRKDIEFSWAGPLYKGAGQKGYSNYQVNMIKVPRYIHQVKFLEDKENWYRAMNEEMDSMVNNRVFTLVDKPRSDPVLPLMWIYRIKFNSDNSIEKYKARLVCLGNYQDTNKSTSSPVINDLSMRILLAYGCKNKMFIHQLDVCTAYLNSPIDELIYVQQPPGFNSNKQKVWRLNKSIYGLKVSAINWYKTFTSILIEMKFIRSKVDDCVFIYRLDNECAVIGLYVDDILVMSSTLKLLIEIKSELAKRIKITDKGEIHHFLNMNFKYDQQKAELKIDLKNYVESLLEDLDMSECKIKKTPIAVGTVLVDDQSKPLIDKSDFMSVLGRLIYLSTKGRYDLLYAIGRLCTVMASPTESNWQMVKHVLRYLKYTKNYSIYFKPNKDDLVIFSDSDFGNSLNGKSVTGICTLLHNCVLNCLSRAQSSVAVSTTEAEINSICEAVYDQIYVSDLYTELTGQKLKCIIYNDNQSSLSTVKSMGEFSRNRHYRMRINLIRESVNSEHVDLKYVASEDNLADVFTKPSSANRLFRVLSKLGIN